MLKCFPVGIFRSKPKNKTEIFSELFAVSEISPLMAPAVVNPFSTAAVCFLAVASSTLYFSTVVSGAAGKESFVKKTVAANAIVIFSKSYCPYCRRAKAVFRELNKVPYIVELDQRGEFVAGPFSFPQRFKIVDQLIVADC
ncbi:Glutaredoxin-C4 [Platanthera guangdongensis]|uniref:Glutaredoxin-C4 n=1 Tax=Platanthera guangdongensis TaxID=2320717 RepID=A0ABR2MN37_9ASPA